MPRDWLCEESRPSSVPARHGARLPTSCPLLCIIWLVFPENLIGIEHRRYIMTVRYSSSTAFQMISNIQPQQQTIVKSGWIIEAIFIQDEGFGQRANFQQMMPIERTAREPRDLQTHN